MDRSAIYVSDSRFDYILIRIDKRTARKLWNTGVHDIYVRGRYQWPHDGIWIDHDIDKFDSFVNAWEYYNGHDYGYPCFYKIGRTRDKCC